MIAQIILASAANPLTPVAAPYLPSLGCAVVIAIALATAGYQGWLHLRSYDRPFIAWGALLSLMTAIFSASSFVQYNQPGAGLAEIAERVQFSTFPLMAHCLFGFSYRFFNKDPKKLNRFLIPFDFLMIMLVWLPGVVLTDKVVYKHISSLVVAYPEPQLGPLGTPFIAVVYLLSASSTLIWLTRFKDNRAGTIPYLAGFSIWALTALHDALVTFGMPTYFYLMSFGVLGFNLAVIWTTAEDYLALQNQLKASKLQLEQQVDKKTAELLQKTDQLKEQLALQNDTQKALAQSEQRLSLALEATSDGLWDWDLEANQVYFSPRYYTMLGYEPEEFPASQEAWRKMLHPDDKLRITGILDKLLSGQRKEYRAEYRLKTKDGQWRWILSRGKVVSQRPDGAASRLIGTHVDIHDRKASEEQRISLEKQLLHSQKMEAVGTLAGGVAHDFNNILTAVLGYAEQILEASGQNGRCSKEASQIIKSVERARKLVRQILIFSRNVDIQSRPLNLNDEVRQAIEMLVHTLPKMIDCHARLAPDLKPIKADGDQIQQVLINLATNAADAMPDGGRMVFETANVSLPEEDHSQKRDLRPGEYVRLKVSDTGIGMDEAIVQQIFNPFFTTKEVGKGTGLGLATVYGIVKSYRGQIYCQSRPGEGTVFEVYLPIDQGLAEVEPPSPPAREKAAGGSEAILLVDDERALRELGSEMLTSVGNKVDLARDGEEAVEIYQNNMGRIDLVILDLGMPGMGGMWCLEEILRIDPEAMVLVVTGYSATVKPEDILAVGAKGFLSKPYRRSELLAAVRDALQK